MLNNYKDKLFLRQLAHMFPLSNIKLLFIDHKIVYDLYNIITYILLWGAIAKFAEHVVLQENLFPEYIHERKMEGQTTSIININHYKDYTFIYASS